MCPPLAALDLNELNLTLEVEAWEGRLPPTSVRGPRPENGKRAVWLRFGDTSALDPSRGVGEGEAAAAPLLGPRGVWTWEGACASAPHL